MIMLKVEILRKSSFCCNLLFGWLVVWALKTVIFSDEKLPSISFVVVQFFLSS